MLALGLFFEIRFLGPKISRDGNKVGRCQGMLSHPHPCLPKPSSSLQKSKHDQSQGFLVGKALPYPPSL